MITTAFQHLINEKENLSKLRNLHYSELKLQSYLSCCDTTIRQKKLLYQFKNRMFKCADNMGDKLTKCSWCNIAPAQQQHYFECDVIKALCPELRENKDNVVYEDVFSDSEEKETNVARLLEKIVRVMETTEGKQQQ